MNQHRITRVKNSKITLKTISFVAGVLLLVTACLMLLKPLSPNSFKTTSVFELGILADQIGEVSILRDKKVLSSKSGIKIYSGDIIKLKKDAEVSVNISDERITVLGPADFEVAFPKKDSRDVFLNFSTFTKTDLIDKKPEHIWIVYKNWYVEPGFGLDVVEATNYQSLSLPKENFDDESSVETSAANKEVTTTNKSNLNTGDQESSLEEAIAVKRPLLKRCYENYLKKNPQATGELTVEFTVQSSGKVSSSKISESSFINDSLFKTCIREVFRKIKARSFAGEPLTVTYPIVFE